MKLFIICLALLLGLFVLLIGINSHVDFPTEKYHVIPINDISTCNLTHEGYFYPSSQNITIKYLRDVGLVVKWSDDSNIVWIQRLEPWLDEHTNTKYNVTWEQQTDNQR